MMSTATGKLMSGRAARLAIGCTAYELLRLVATGELRPVAEPGRYLRYPADEVERLAAERNPATDGATERA